MAFILRYPNATLSKVPSYLNGDHLSVDEDPDAPDGEWVGASGGESVQQVGTTDWYKSGTSQATFPAEDVMAYTVVEFTAPNESAPFEAWAEYESGETSINADYTVTNKVTVSSGTSFLITFSTTWQGLYATPPPARTAQFTIYAGTSFRQTFEVILSVGDAAA